jgi:hypothetical protein
MSVLNSFDAEETLVIRKYLARTAAAAAATAAWAA